MSEPQLIWKVLSDFSNPVYLSVIFGLVAAVIIYSVFRYVILPNQIKHEQEKNQILASFAKLDPDPLLRFDKSGKIILINDSAAELFGRNLLNRNINDVLAVQFIPAELITKNFKLNVKEVFSGKIYSIAVNPIPQLGVAQVYFNNITELMKASDELKQHQKRLKNINNYLQTKIEDEKSRIARDLHDSVGQMVLLTKLKVQNYIPADELNDNNEIIGMFEKVITELKNIIYGLKPKMLEECGIPASVAALINSINDNGFIKGEFEYIGEEERFHPKLEILCYRIIQEAVSNIVKHSGADDFNIRIINYPGFLRISVEDNGIGFDSELSTGKYTSGSASSGYGLWNIKERVESINGSFILSSAKGKGTGITVEFSKEYPENGKYN